MASDCKDTITALATPPGIGAIAVVRISGPATAGLAVRVLGTLPAPRHARFGPFADLEGRPIDSGIALYFPGPHSFTGEDVLELHCHGGPVLVNLLLGALHALGARPARPGEFSLRAFLNGKIDLAQAEAVADLIASTTTQAARAALRSLNGEFSRRVRDLLDALIELRIYVESAIDFPEEEIDFLSEGQVQTQLQKLRDLLAAAREATRQGSLLREGMTVVIAGPPNAGKSSLLNALAGRETAIVTEIPGTTRDLLREQIQLEGMPLHVMDTAGLRPSADPVEQEGIRRAQAAIAAADRILLVVDIRDHDQNRVNEIIASLPESVPLTVIENKIDLIGLEPELVDGIDQTRMRISAKSGAGLDLLRAHLKRSMGFHPGHEGTFSARRRHLEALAQASECLQRGWQQLTQQQAGELLAEDLREAQRALSEITGEFTSEDLLERIFSSFCVGK
jgi:tRNA modification GTPase